MINKYLYKTFTIPAENTFDEKSRMVTVCCISTIDGLDKRLSIGLAVCNPLDTFRFEEGKTISKLKAENNPCTVIATNNKDVLLLGTINYIVDILIDQIQIYPENYIKSYKKAMDTFNLENEYNVFLETCTEKEDILALAVTITPEDVFEKASTIFSNFGSLPSFKDKTIEHIKKFS